MRLDVDKIERLVFDLGYRRDALFCKATGLNPSRFANLKVTGRMGYDFKRMERVEAVATALGVKPEDIEAKGE